MIEVSETLPDVICQDKSIYGWFAVKNLSDKTAALVMIAFPSDFHLTLTSGKTIGNNTGIFLKKKKATAVLGDFTIKTPRYNENESTREFEIKFTVCVDEKETTIIKKKYLSRKACSCD